MSKILIAFFSRPGENLVNGNMKYLEVGNTKVVADKLHEMIPEADMFQIEAANPYSDKYLFCNSRAKQEYESGALPMLAKSLSIEGYDEIYLGFPLWYRSFPRPVATFIELNKDLWNGKKVHFFCTNDEGFYGLSEIEMSHQVGKKGGILSKGLSIRGKDTSGLEAWVKSHN